MNQFNEGFLVHEKSFNAFPKDASETDWKIELKWAWFLTAVLTTLLII